MSENLQKKYEWIYDPQAGFHVLCRHRDAGLDSDCELNSDDEANKKKGKDKTPQYGHGAGWYSMDGYGPFGGYPDGRSGYIGPGHYNGFGGGYRGGYGDW